MLQILKLNGPSWDALAPNRPFSAKAGRGAMVLWEQDWGLVLERPYRHGGFFRFLGRRFFSESRPKRELEVHSFAKQKGVPCVEPLGYLKRGRGWKRGYSYLTQFVHKAVSPTFYLKKDQVPRATIRSWQETLLLLFEHVEHPDLNLNNFLFDGQRWLILDFDKAKVRKRTVIENASKGLSRLYRSWLKLGFVGRHRHLRFRILVWFARQLDVSARDLLQQVQLTNFRLIRSRFY